MRKGSLGINQQAGGRTSGCLKAGPYHLSRQPVPSDKFNKAGGEILIRLFAKTPVPKPTNRISGIDKAHPLEGWNTLSVIPAVELVPLEQSPIRKNSRIAMGFSREKDIRREDRQHKSRHQRDNLSFHKLSPVNEPAVSV